MEEISVRDGRQVSPYCPECGCRLHQMPGCKHWKHFRTDYSGKDARGCKCSEVGAGGSIYKGQIIFSNAGYNCE